MLQQGRGEHVVDDQRGPGPMHDPGDRGDVDEFERRIGRRFEERCFRVRPQGRAPGVEIGAVDESRGDAEAGQQVLDHVETRAEQGSRRDDMVTRLELAHERRRDGGHSARGRARGLGALEQRHPLLEHRHGRIGEARIDEARIVALEARLRELHRVVEIALGEKQGLRRLLEARTQRSAMDQLRRGPQRLRIAGFTRARHPSSPYALGAPDGLWDEAGLDSAPIF